MRTRPDTSAELTIWMRYGGTTLGWGSGGLGNDDLPRFEARRLLDVAAGGVGTGSR